MIQHLKALLLKTVIMVTAFSVMGIPSFYHHCLQHGNHNWQTAFVADADEHCVCCKDVESSCCENAQHHQHETAVTHATCCSIEVVSLQITAIEYSSKQQLKQLLNIISTFDAPRQYISNRIFYRLDFSLPLPYPNCSPPRAAIILFMQFLL